MKKLLLILGVLFLSGALFAQKSYTEKDEYGDYHISGSIDVKQPSEKALSLARRWWEISTESCNYRELSDNSFSLDASINIKKSFMIGAGDKEDNLHFLLTITFVDNQLKYCLEDFYIKHWHEAWTVDTAEQVKTMMQKMESGKKSLEAAGLDKNAQRDAEKEVKEYEALLSDIDIVMERTLKSFQTRFSGD